MKTSPGKFVVPVVTFFPQLPFCSKKTTNGVNRYYNFQTIRPQMDQETAGGPYYYLNAASFKNLSLPPFLYKTCGQGGETWEIMEFMLSADNLFSDDTVRFGDADCPIFGASGWQTVSDLRDQIIQIPKGQEREFVLYVALYLPGRIWDDEVANGYALMLTYLNGVRHQDYSKTTRRKFRPSAHPDFADTQQYSRLYRIAEKQQLSWCLRAKSPGSIEPSLKPDQELEMLAQINEKSKTCGDVVAETKEEPNDGPYSDPFSKSVSTVSNPASNPPLYSLGKSLSDIIRKTRFEMVHRSVSSKSKHPSQSPTDNIVGSTLSSPRSKHSVPHNDQSSSSSTLLSSSSSTKDSTSSSETNQRTESKSTNSASSEVSVSVGNSSSIVGESTKRTLDFDNVENKEIDDGQVATPVQSTGHQAKKAKKMKSPKSPMSARRLELIAIDQVQNKKCLRKSSRLLDTGQIVNNFFIVFILLYNLITIWFHFLLFQSICNKLDFCFKDNF